VPLEHGRFGTCGRYPPRRFNFGELGKIDRLSKYALPASGRVLPVMTSIIVVLPAPLGPITQRSSPASTMSDRLSSA
jgi:hypothetical protein